VANIVCTTCGGELGWRYVAAQEEEQRYKVGKYILETKRVVRAANWEEDGDEVEEDVGSIAFGKVKGVRGGDTDDEHGDVLFDSQDEEECEDLFMGIWSEKLALKRRRDKMWKDM
jgi:Yippee zinc-binding/DNA-binding /Mis18, centromere assembly